MEVCRFLIRKIRQIQNDLSEMSSLSLAISRQSTVYGGSGGGSGGGSDANVENVAVATSWFLSHLQRLVVVISRRLSGNRPMQIPS